MTLPNRPTTECFLCIASIYRNRNLLQEILKYCVSSGDVLPRGTRLSVKVPLVNAFSTVGRRCRPTRPHPFWSRLSTNDFTR